MMFSLGKPVLVLVKKKDEENLRKALPSDIVWKMRVVPYEEFIDITEGLSQQLQNRPQVEPPPSLAEEAKEVFAEADSRFARTIDRELKKLKREQEEKYERLEELFKQARLSEPIQREKEIEISPSLGKRIKRVHEKLEPIEKLVGFPENPEIALGRGNWHYQRNEFDKALELYDWALTLKADDEIAWANKDLALNELGRYEEAIACHDKAIELKQDYETA